MRATQDVDLIVEIANLANHYELQDELKRIGFLEDPDVICRWNLKGIKVDVMPTDGAILGFTNRWYIKAIACADSVSLPSGRLIEVVAPPMFLATKIEAFKGRGDGDYGSSHDIEDIVAVVDGRPELAGEVAAFDEAVREYLRDEVGVMLEDVDFTDHLIWHLGPDEASPARTAEVIRRLRLIAGL